MKQWSCVQIYFKNWIKLQLLATSLPFFCCYLKNFPSWIQIRTLNADPDPGGKIHANPYGSGSTALVEIDKKDCSKVIHNVVCPHLVKNFLNKITIFSPQIFPSWIWIWILILNADPDLGGKMNVDPCRSTSTALSHRLQLHNSV